MNTMANLPAPINITSLLSTRVDELPPHITHEEYKRLRAGIENHWLKRKETASGEFYRRRDLLFVDLLWASGARISDVCHLQARDVDFTRRRLTVAMQKVKRPTIVTLDSDLLLDISRFVSDFKIGERLFDFGRVRAWKMLKAYAESAGLEAIHPHKFRHGLAIHLLQQGVPIPVISARLGHASVYVTMQMYMKVTPDIQAALLKNVEWR